MNASKSPSGKLKDPRYALVVYALTLTQLLLILFGERMGHPFAASFSSLMLSLTLIFFIVSQKFKISKFLGMVALLWSFVLLLTSIFSHVVEKSIFEFAMYAGYILTFFASYQLSKKDNSYVMWFITRVFFVGIVMTLVFIVKEGLRPGFWEAPRLSGTFYWHNQMAQFVAFGIPISIALFQTTQKRFLWAFSALLFALGLFLTSSRGMWLSLGISGICTLIFFPHVRKHAAKYRKHIVVCMIVTFALVSALEPVRNRITSIPYEFIKGSTSAQVRTHALSVSQRITADHLYKGIGPGVFGEAYYAYQPVPWLYAKHPHNHFAQMFAETGVVGGSLFILFIFGFVALVLKNAKRIKSPLEIALVIGCLSAIIHAFLDVDWNYPSLGILFWSCVGFIAPRVEAKEYTLKKLHVGLFCFFILCFGLYSFLIQTKLQSIKTSQAELDYTNVEYNALSLASIAPFSYTADFFLGNSEYTKMNFNEAISYYTKAQYKNPFNAELLFAQCRAYKSLNDFENEKQCLEKSIELNRFSNPRYYLLLAEHANEKETILNAGVEAFPYSQQYKDFEYLYQATGLNFILAGLHNQYAEILYKNNDFDKATIYRENASKFAPGFIQNE